MQEFDTDGRRATVANCSSSFIVLTGQVNAEVFVGAANEKYHALARQAHLLPHIYKPLVAATDIYTVRLIQVFLLVRKSRARNQVACAQSSNDDDTSDPIEPVVIPGRPENAVRMTYCAFTESAAASSPREIEDSLLVPDLIGFRSTLSPGD